MPLRHCFAPDCRRHVFIDIDYFLHYFCFISPLSRHYAVMIAIILRRATITLHYAYAIIAITLYSRYATHARPFRRCRATLMPLLRLRDAAMLLFHYFTCCRYLAPLRWYDMLIFFAAASTSCHCHATDAADMPPRHYAAMLLRRFAEPLSNIYADLIRHYTILPILITPDCRRAYALRRPYCRHASCHATLPDAMRHYYCCRYTIDMPLWLYFCDTCRDATMLIIITPLRYFEFYRRHIIIFSLIWCLSRRHCHDIYFAIIYWLAIILIQHASLHYWLLYHHHYRWPFISFINIIYFVIWAINMLIFHCHAWLLVNATLRHIFIGFSLFHSLIIAIFIIAHWLRHWFSFSTLISPFLLFSTLTLLLRHCRFAAIAAFHYYATPLRLAILPPFSFWFGHCADIFTFIEYYWQALSLILPLRHWPSLPLLMPLINIDYYCHWLSHYLFDTPLPLRFHAIAIVFNIALSWIEMNRIMADYLAGWPPLSAGRRIGHNSHIWLGHWLIIYWAIIIAASLRHINTLPRAAAIRHYWLTLRCHGHYFITASCQAISIFISRHYASH